MKMVKVGEAQQNFNVWLQSSHTAPVAIMEDNREMAVLVDPAYFRRLAALEQVIQKIMRLKAAHPELATRKGRDSLWDGLRRKATGRTATGRTEKDEARIMQEAITEVGAYRFATEECTVFLSVEILEEYTEVLQRKKFSKYHGDMDRILADMLETGVLQYTVPRADVQLPDPKDHPYIDLALAVSADYLVTGNLKDFPEGTYGRTRVVSPAKFLKLALEKE